MEENIKFKLNGKSVEVKVAKDRTLLWVLRTKLSLTGTKYGCGEGYCGSCTILVNGEPVRSCNMTMDETEGKEIVTIE